jgi:hypothetical protein
MEALPVGFKSSFTLYTTPSFSAYKTVPLFAE